MAARGSDIKVTVRRNWITGWFADRSVATKGLVAAAITAVVAIAVTLLSASRMAELDRDLVEMKQVHVASQQTLGDVRGAVGEVFRGMFLFSNPDASAYLGEGKRSVDDADALMDRAIAGYRALPGGSKARTDALNSLADAWADHRALRDAVFFDKALPAGMTMPPAEEMGVKLNADEQRMDAAISLLVALQHTEANTLAAESSAEYRDARTTMIIALGVGLLLSLLVSLWIARITRRQLREATQALNALAGGDLSHVAAVRSRDELGGIAAAVNRATGGLREMVRALNAGARTLGESSQQLTGVTGRIGASAQEAAAQANLVAAAAGDVSANVLTVSAGSQEMGSSIQEIARNANDAAVVAAEAVGVAQSTNQTVSKLGDSSAEIGNVVKVITSIAGQTNLLALNATIEAARAGEAGRGFAVVANEVKDLAQETARATEDISRRVEAIQSDTANAVAAIGEIGQIIARINDYQLTIASAVEEQTATTAEMTRSVGDAASGTADIAANINGVAVATQATTTTLAEAEATMAELASVAADLQAVVGQFRL